MNLSSKLLFGVLSCILILFCAACILPAQSAELLPARVSLEEASVQVWGVLEETHPDLNPEFEFSLVEITTDEVWQELGLQVFKMSDNGVIGPETYVLGNGLADHIGFGFGGWGVTQIFATDLNQDGRYELTYTYSWGSGIHRAHLAMYLPDAETGQHLYAEEVYLDGDYVLDQVNEHFVQVYGVTSLVAAEPPILLGKLVLTEVGDKLVLQLIAE